MMTTHVKNVFTRPPPDELDPDDFDSWALLLHLLLQYKPTALPPHHRHFDIEISYFKCELFSVDSDGLFKPAAIELLYGVLG